MKQLKYLVVIMFLLILTGCSSYEMSMKIGKNKDMDLNVIILTDSKEELEENISNLRFKYEEYGYDINEYNVSDGYGIKVHKHFDDIDNISFGERSDEFDLLYMYNNDYDKNLEIKMFNVSKSVDANRYAANFILDLSDLDIKSDDVVFEVYLPSQSLLSSNASLVNEDGTKLIWNINTKEKNDIDFTFELKSYDTIYYIAGIIIAIILVIAIFSNLFGKNISNIGNKNSDNDYMMEIEKDKDITANLAGVNNDTGMVNKTEDTMSTSLEDNKVNSMDMFNVPLINDNTSFSDDNNVTLENNPVIDDSENNVLPDITETSLEENFEQSISQDNNLDDSVIRVNNKEVVVTKNKKEDN